MRFIGQILGFAGLLALVVLSAPGDAFAEKKKKKEAKAKETAPAATDADYKGIQKQKELTGKLVSVDAKIVTLRAEYSHYEANPKYKPPTAKPGQPGYNQTANQQGQMWRTYNDIMKQQQKLALAKNPREYQQAMMRLQQDMMRLQQEIVRMQQTMAKGTAAGQKVDPNNQPFITVTNTKDFDLEVEEKVVLRKLFLPFEYDDTGKVKTYTDKEKAELRGDDKTKPGYKAKFEDFAPGQDVKLYLTPPKKMEKPKDTDKDDKAPEEVLRPTVNMIVMTKENMSASSIQGAPEKKGKK
ncbi:MAG: hypothetical protein HY289_08350 [Planctomycetes bacterium]|nr:hypothetical protein [Planctomycetota bacterium]